MVTYLSGIEVALAECVVKIADITALATDFDLSVKDITSG